MNTALLEHVDTRATSVITRRDAVQTTIPVSRPSASRRTSVWCLLVDAFAAGRASHVVGPRASVDVAANFAGSVRP